MKFAMPMVKDFVPKAVRPWLYVVMALCFQVSAARYLGALNEIIGATAQMREDVLMCLYCNLAGMALWFPMLFRMKFRFTNKTLLVAAHGAGHQPAHRLCHVAAAFMAAVFY